jgi:hypothetical protein
MKKVFFILLVVFGSMNAFSQGNVSEVTLFGQCMIEIENPEEMRALEVEMRTNPYLKVVRLDYTSQRAFILTKGIDALTEENFISWFNQYSDKVRCVQIGVHGIDIVKPYPFEGCEK